MQTYGNDDVRRVCKPVIIFTSVVRFVKAAKRIPVHCLEMQFHRIEEKTETDARLDAVFETLVVIIELRTILVLNLSLTLHAHPVAAEQTGIDNEFQMPYVHVHMGQERNLNESITCLGRAVHIL